MLGSRKGMTLVELIVAFTILLVLTSMAVPMARMNVRRMKERQLREALEEMRHAIDKYKRHGGCRQARHSKAGCVWLSPSRWTRWWTA